MLMGADECVHSLECVQENASSLKCHSAICKLEQLLNFSNDLSRLGSVSINKRPHATIDAQLATTT